MSDYFDLLPDPGAVVAQDGRIEAVNAAWRGAVGKGASEWGCLQDLTHPEDWPALAEAIAAVSGHALRDDACCGARLSGSDGNWRPLDLRLRRDRASGRILLTGREVALDHARLRMALEALPDGFVLYDSDNRLVLCNSEFRALFAPLRKVLRPGARLEEVVQAMLDTQVYPDAVGQEAMWFDRATPQPPAGGLDYEVRFHGDRWLRINEHPTPDGGRVALCIDITQQVRNQQRARTAEAAALRSRERLTAAIEALEDGFVLFDAEDRLILCNRKYRDIHDPIRDIIAPGVYFGDILRAGLDCQLFPEAIGREEEWYAQNIAIPPPEGHTLEVNFADGRWMRIVERPTPEGGRVGLRIDITRQVESRHRAERAEADARRARESLTSAIEALEDGFVLFDAEDKLVLCNRKYLETYPAAASVMKPGVSFATILRTSAMAGEIVDAIGREEEWLAERLSQHRQAADMIEQRLSDGRVLRIYETPTSDGGRVGLRIDVTELHQARDRAEAANRAKSNFLSNMSHEIRTPLNAVLGMADLLAESPLAPDQEEMLMIIRESGWSLLSLINDILDLARVEAGKLILEEQPFAPTELIERIVALHSANAKAKGVGLIVDHGACINRVRLGDMSRIAQILHNVIGNALKFTDQGEVRLSIEACSSEMLCFRVRDTGIGMSPEQIKRVFEPFEQAEAGTTRRFGGTGLGMSIVLRLVDLMQGDISVESALGQGTSVAIRLQVPVTEAPHPAQPADAPAADRSVASLSGGRILVADDNTANRKILAAYLAKLDLSVDFARDGAEACAMWREAAYDLVLMDISMPVMGGVEALSEMRRESRARARVAPCAIAVTANVMHEQVAQYLRDGFIDVIHKPIRQADLQAALLRHLREPVRSFGT